MSDDGHEDQPIGPRGSDRAGRTPISNGLWNGITEGIQHSDPQGIQEHVGDAEKAYADTTRAPAETGERIAATFDKAGEDNNLLDALLNQPAGNNGSDTK